MRVGIVGDQHLPFEHENYLKFCSDTFRFWKVDTVVFAGDVIDGHALSFWEHNPDGLSAGDEYSEAMEHLEPWVKKWPIARVCIGSHDARHFRTARKAGLPAIYLKHYREIFKTPKWHWQFEHEIDGVIYTHGSGVSGKGAALNAALQRRASLCIGHTHTYSGVTYHANDTSRIFAMQVGCGVDVSRYTFEYQKDLPVRPVLSCGIVIDGTRAIVEPMLIGKGEKYEK